MKRFAIAASCVALLLGLLLAPAGPANAFCIYNRSDKEVKVEEVGGGSFWRQFHDKIKAGDHACCNWKNKDCNKHGKRDSVLRFNVSYGGDDVCQEVEVEAGGWMDIKRSGNIFICTVHNN